MNRLHTGSLQALRSRADYIALGLLSFALYANTIPGEFVWDDSQLIAGFPTLKLALTRHFLCPSFYRPIPALSIYLDARRFGDAAAGFHVTNVLLHSVTTVLVYALAMHLSSRRYLAAIAGLTFAVVPVHVESVAWISDRTDLLCALFFVAALISHILYRKANSRFWLIAASISFLAALLSKEAAIVFPLVVLAYEWIYGHLGRRRARNWIIFYSVAFLLYSSARFAALGVSHAVSSPQKKEMFYEPAPLAHRIIGLPVNIWRYVWLSIIPHDPGPVYSATATGDILRVDVLGSVLMCAFATVGIIWLRRRRPEASFGLVLFGLSILPACNIVQLPGTTMGERMAYLPSAGLALSLASIIAGAIEWKARLGARLKLASIIALLSVFIVYSAYCTVRGNLTWRDEFSLWSKAVAQARDVEFAHNNLGKAYRARGLPDMAIEEHKKAIRLSPRFALAHADLGCALRDMGELEEAVREFRIALSLEPLLYETWNNLGVALCMQKKYEQAIEPYQRAIKLVPGLVAARTNLGRVYQQLGRYREAIREYRQALRLQPEMPNIELELARCYRWAGLAKEARTRLSRLASQTEDLDIRIQAQDELDQMDLDLRGMGDARK